MYYAIERQHKSSGLFSKWKTKSVLFVGTLEDCFDFYNQKVVRIFTDNNYNRTKIVKHTIK